MASILPVGSRWRAQVHKRGQSIAKTFKTESAADAWARKREAEIGEGQNAVDAATVTVGDLVRKCRQARADSKRAVVPKSNEHYILQRHRPEVAAPTGHKGWRNLKRYTNLDPAQVAKKGRLKLVKAGWIIKVEAAAVVAVIQPA
ncbi:hypothetical protein J2794_001713 [Paraburkholderia terricola]|uniref:hypothetical protein n=1 Tax=Paraburkholderia terricola TaxID=169427 RepID=UPI002860C66B|nr:hypothetical protein [Paraburkholderia terricola]MDR6445622.1 hypothetical protein [Paraburkholderia terricola]